MNRYYLLKHADPHAAQKALIVILRQDNSYLPALKELSQIYIKEKNNQAALPLMEQLHKLLPNNSYYTQQLATLYYEQSEWQKAQFLFKQIGENKSSIFSAEALKMLDKMDSAIPYYNIGATVESKQEKASNDSSLVAQILLNYFYKIQKETPKEAEHLLSLLDLISPGNYLIHEEKGYIALKRGDEKQAIEYFSQAYNENPLAQIALQLANIYVSQKNNQQAAQLFLLASRSDDLQIKNTALKGYEVTHQIGSFAVVNTQFAQKNTATVDSIMLDQFYALKKYNKDAAWLLIQKIIDKYPENSIALKEGGFLAIDKGYRTEAITYLTKAYKLTYQPDLAMQLGYLYDQGITADNKYTAYQYFKRATQTNDKNLELRAQNALTNLAGLQTKAFPDPYFGEIFFDPFTQNRFGLTVRPLVARFGVEQYNRLQSKTYLVFRQTDDNKSSNTGQLPQIYEDSVRLIGVGFQITPVKNFPLIAFIEAGRAYDLVYRDRDRWRGDLRGGVMYYNEFGARPAYFDQLKFSTAYYSTLYGDVTYFSRYDNNVIGTIKTHQGIRLIQYHSSMINLYLTGRVIQDSRREFFNNIAEVGPGIGFIPSNRFRLQIRFEHINGMYLPAGGSVNPYGKYYTNNMVQLLLYVKV
jgi:tetratricopeptide (TPR) repeat protein